MNKFRAAHKRIELLCEVFHPRWDQRVEGTRRELGHARILASHGARAQYWTRKDDSAYTPEKAEPDMHLEQEQE